MDTRMEHCSRVCPVGIVEVRPGAVLRRDDDVRMGQQMTESDQIKMDDEWEKE